MRSRHQADPPCGLAHIDGSGYVAQACKKQAHGAEYRQADQAQGAQARYPGMRQHQCEIERRAEGILLTPALARALHAVALPM